MTGEHGDRPNDGGDERDDRLAALETRIEKLEAEDDASGATSDERVDELAAEVAELRAATERLESTLDDALADLDEIRESEYGAISEKRERQFETAVKSMVAFHQLATEVLDVRVENFEPSAGRADAERVEITRNRIGDALGVGQHSGGENDATDLDAFGDESDWPDPEEAARGGVVGDDSDDADETTVEELADTSDAPDTGVYPPIGDDEPDEPDGERNDGEPTEASRAPETGVYPPIGGSDDGSTADSDEPGNESTGGADGALPESIRPDADDAGGGITETAAEEGHVVDPIRSADAGPESAGGPPLDTDPETALAVRDAVVAAREDPEPTFDDPYPDGEAYARIVGERGDDESDLPAGQSEPDDGVTVRVVDGQGPERTASDDDD